jgi:hypothetical protein
MQRIKLFDCSDLLLMKHKMHAAEALGAAATTKKRLPTRSTGARSGAKHFPGSFLLGLSTRWRYQSRS